MRLLRLFRLVRHVLRSPLASTCAKQARSLAHANDLIFMEIDFSIAAFGAFVPLGASCAKEPAL